MIRVLLKKQLDERFSVFKHDKKSVDVLGLLLTFIMYAGVIAVVVFVFAKFAKVYLNIRFDDIADFKTRQFEILTIAYFGIFIFGVFSGIKSIGDAVFESDDFKIFSTLPIKPTDLFLSKLITVYTRQTLGSIVTIFTINLTFGIIADQSAGYIALTVLMCFLLPLITLSFASVLSLPVYYVKKKIQSKYVLSLIVVTVVTGLIFWGYSEILSFFRTVISNGQLEFFFSEQTMLKIGEVTSKLYPANMFAGILLNVDPGKNWGIFFATLAGGALIGLPLVKLLYYRVANVRCAAPGRIYRKAESPAKRRPVLLGFMKKEFNSVMRTPDYAFSYFTALIIMPLMVYFCIGITRDMLSTLVYIDCDLELAITVVLLLGVLTNTFCATNISRDGKSFLMYKTMPLSYKQPLAAKIIFCLISSLLSLIISCVVLGASGFLSAGETAFVFVVAAFMSVGEICFATRHDLNKPNFKEEEDGSVKESTRTVSVLIALGCMSAVIIGGLSVFMEVRRSLIGGSHISLFTYLFAGIGALALMCAGIAYLLAGLRKTYYTMREDG